MLGVRVPPGLPAYLKKGEIMVLKKVTGFLSEAKAELKKVSWPSRSELMNSTLVVIVSVIILAVYIGAVDVILSKLVGLVIR